MDSARPMFLKFRIIEVEFPALIPHPPKKQYILSLFLELVATHNEEFRASLSARVTAITNDEKW